MADFGGGDNHLGAFGMRGVGVAVRSEPGEATVARFAGDAGSAAEAASRPRFAPGTLVNADSADILKNVGVWTTQAQVIRADVSLNTEGTDTYAQLVLLPVNLCDLTILT